MIDLELLQSELTSNTTPVVDLPQPYIHDCALTNSDHDLFPYFRLPNVALRPEFERYSKNEIRLLRNRPCSMCVAGALDWQKLLANDFESGLISLHTRLYGRRRGVRTGPARTQKTKGDGIHHVVFPDPNSFPSHLAVIEQLYQQPAIDNLFYSSMLIWYFLLRVHPFPDGNGRTARLLAALAYQNWTGGEEVSAIPLVAYKSNSDWFTYFLWEAGCEHSISRLFHFYRDVCMHSQLAISDLQR